MKVVLDLNLWIDIAARPRTYPESADLFRTLETLLIPTYFPLCGYTTVYYVLQRVLKPEGAREFLQTIFRRGVLGLQFRKEEVDLAQALGIADHEDACVVASAVTECCDLIVTRNPRDFQKSPIAAKSPKAALKLVTKK